MKTKLSLVLAVLCFSSNVHAAPIDYDISWTGNNGFTLDGMFSFDDTLLGTGAITSIWSLAGY